MLNNIVLNKVCSSVFNSVFRGITSEFIVELNEFNKRDLVEYL